MNLVFVFYNFFKNNSLIQLFLYFTIRMFDLLNKFCFSGFLLYPCIINPVALQCGCMNESYTHITFHETNEIIELTLHAL